MAGKLKNVIEDNPEEIHGPMQLSHFRTKITDLNLSLRCENCLDFADIKTLGELLTYTAEDLLKLRNFGRLSLEELRIVLREMGLRLKNDE